MFGRETILNKTPEAGGCTNTVDLYNPFPDGGGQALYQLNGDATDESGNYDGNFVNPAYGTGEFGQAGVFNGSSSYIDTTYTMPASSTYSISAWFKTSTTGTQEIIIADFDASGSGLTVRFTLGFISSNNFYINMGNGSSSWSNYTTNALPYRDGNWHNIVTVWNGTNVKLYADGNTTPIADLTSTVSAGAAGTSPLNFGRAGDVSGSYFNGSIDQVRIFNRALRPYEVEALYTEEYCTPTIVPSKHFNTVLYTGTGATNPVTGVGFQPDLVWIKNRDAAQSNRLYDSVRGANLQLSSNQTAAESNNGGLTSFDSNGFSLDNWASVNTNTNNYVAWNFKAGGAAVTNTDGTITSQVSANTEAGFSVVKFTGNTVSGATIGHGLGDTPTIIIAKSLGGGTNWCTQFPSVIGAGNSLFLNSTVAVQNHGTGQSNRWTQTLPTSSVFSIGGSTELNDNGVSVVAYCFAEVEGFSNFGSYAGTGASGNIVVTGFEPAFVMMKAYDDTSDWFIVDNKRNITDPRNSNLRPNNSNAEADAASGLNFLENGFEFTGAAFNDNNVSWIYMAFAADPTTIEPSLEDSFNTVLYSGNGSATQQVTGVGFQPDFTWIKDRINSGTSHFLQDSVRGFSGASPNWAYSLLSDETISESTTGQSWRDNQGGVSSFDSDGFSVWTGASPSNSAFNKPAANYVAWNWKGAEIPAINSNGSIPSVVSANPAAGFSIVSYSGNSDANATIGHGLNNQPKFVVVKRVNVGGYNWMVGYLDGGVQHSLYLNTTAARDNELNRSPIAFTESTFKPSTIVGDHTNGTGYTYIAYCFAEVAGFSKFGSYIGGSTGSGNVIDVGFKPLFLMVKRTDAAGDAWQMFDTVRGGGDTFDNYVQANNSAEEVSYNQREVNFTNNGFYWTYAESGTNISGGTYIYMAFANQF